MPDDMFRPKRKQIDLLLAAAIRVKFLALREVDGRARCGATTRRGIRRQIRLRIQHGVKFGEVKAWDKPWSYGNTQLKN
jgi:hypothetical protein